MKKIDLSVASPTKAEVDRAALKANVLDKETNDLLESVAAKNYNAIKWFIISWSILFALAVFGIYYQNKLATQNKAHIDCIIKDLATPLPSGSQHKYIQILSDECHIKFTP